MEGRKKYPCRPAKLPATHLKVKQFCLSVNKSPKVVLINFVCINQYKMTLYAFFKFYRAIQEKVQRFKALFKMVTSKKIF